MLSSVSASHSYASSDSLLLYEGSAHAQRRYTFFSNDGQARRNFTLEGVIEMLTFGLIIAADLR